MTAAAQLSRATDEEDTYRIIRKDNLWRVLWSWPHGLEGEVEVFASESAAEAYEYATRPYRELSKH